MSEQEAERKVMNITGRPLRNKDLNPVGKKVILVRMLHNLLNLAERDKDTDAVLRYLDGIVTVDPSFAASVRTDVAWSGIRAVRSNRVYLAPLVPFPWLDAPPSINRLIGLRWLGRILYPDRFAGDLRQETREFYSAFYHRAPDEAQLDALLGAPTRTK